MGETEPPLKVEGNEVSAERKKSPWVAVIFEEILDIEPSPEGWKIRLLLQDGREYLIPMKEAAKGRKDAPNIKVGDKAGIIFLTVECAEREGLTIESGNWEQIGVVYPSTDTNHISLFPGDSNAKA